MPSWYEGGGFTWTGDPTGGSGSTGNNSISTGTGFVPISGSGTGMVSVGGSGNNTTTTEPPPPPAPYVFNPLGWYGGFRFGQNPNLFGQHAAQVFDPTQRAALGLPGTEENQDTMDQAWGSFLAQYGGKLSPAMQFWLNQGGGRQALERAYWGMQETDPNVRFTDVLGRFDPTQSWFMLDPRTAGRPTQYIRTRFNTY